MLWKPKSLGDNLKNFGQPAVKILNGTSAAACHEQASLLPWSYYAYWAVGFYGMAAANRFEWGECVPAASTMNCCSDEMRELAFVLQNVIFFLIQILHTFTDTQKLAGWNKPVLEGDDMTPPETLLQWRQEGTMAAPINVRFVCAMTMLYVP